MDFRVPGVRKAELREKYGGQQNGKKARLTRQKYGDKAPKDVFSCLYCVSV